MTFCLFPNFITSNQITEINPVITGITTCMVPGISNWKIFLTGSTNNSKAINNTVIKIITGTSLFLYLLVVNIEK